MTEIRLDVDFRHPCERVWRALTDPELVPEWFASVESEPDRPGHYVIRMEDVDGITGPIEVELIRYRPMDQIVTRWRGEQLHVRMTITLNPLPTGCRLTFVQNGFVGAQGTLRRRILRAGYDRMLRERLAATLDRMADGPPDRPVAGPAEGGAARRDRNRPGTPSSGVTAPARGVARVPQPRADGSGGTVEPTELRAAVRDWWRRIGRALGSAGGWPGLKRWSLPGWRPKQRRAPGVVVSGATLLLIASVALLAASLTGAPHAGAPQVGGGEVPPPSAAVPGTAPAPATPHTAAAPGTAAGPALGDGAPGRPVRRPEPLAAGFRVDAAGPTGYRGSVTIRNAGARAATWSVVITLPAPGAAVSEVTGAEYRRSGRTVTFTGGHSTRTVGSGSSVRITFRVKGHGPPPRCALGGRRCDQYRDEMRYRPR